MTTLTIQESGMTFGPFSPDDCFAVESCATYAALGVGVKVAEFAWLCTVASPQQLWIVEAKSSTPRPEPEERFAEFIGEIRDKLLNAWTMVVAARVGRPGAATSELPPAVAALDLTTIEPRFILVIRGHRADWLPPLQSALTLAMHATAKTWGISAPAVAVLNDDLARKKNLIQ
jgi:hypothetical protein